MDDPSVGQITIEFANMKICLVSKEYPDEVIGGIGSYTAGMAKALAEKGHIVHVLSYSTDNQRVYLDGNVVVHKMSPWILRHAWAKRYFGNLLHSFYVALKIRNLINEYSVEVVEVPEFAAEGFVYSILPRRKAPLIVRLHTPLKIVEKTNAAKHSTLGYLYIGLLNWMERASILRADAVTSPSHALAEVCREELNLGNLPIHIFPNPVDAEYFTPPKAAEPGKIVLYVGQLGHRKGVDIFREVIPIIWKTHPEARFLFVGSDQGYDSTSSMQDYILQFIPTGQRQNIAFLGNKTWQELRDLYRTAQVCVFPSRFENFPQVCLEAMSCGCLVIGSTSGGMPEIIVDGINGFLAEPGDVNQLCELINRCLSSELPEIKEAARKRITEAFSLPRVADLALAIFKKTFYSS